MTLTFTQENGLYVAEFEATAPFSIHLERPKGGFINMLQRSVDSGTFVAVKNFNPNYNATQVIDADCGQGAVYPKWIRLESAVEPSVAEVTFEDEQSGGGAGTAEPEIVYLTEANGLILEPALAGPAYLAKYRDGENIVIGSISSVAANFGQGTVQPANIIAISFFKTEAYLPDGSFIPFDEFISLMENAGANLTEITKEQFYSLEA